MKIKNVLRIATVFGVIFGLSYLYYKLSLHTNFHYSYIVGGWAAIVYIALLALFYCCSRLVTEIPFAKSYLSFFRFRVLYTKRRSIAGSFLFTAFTLFTWVALFYNLLTFPYSNLADAIRDFPQNKARMVSLFVQLNFFILSALKMPWKAIWKNLFWNSKKSITSYDNRTSETEKYQSLYTSLLHLRSNKVGVSEEWRRIDWMLPDAQGKLEKRDNIFMCSKLNAFLRTDKPLYCSIVNHREQGLYNRFAGNSTLFDYAWEACHLKQKQAGGQRFFNENKINLVGFPIWNKDKESEIVTSLEMKVARSCYYATYVTTEFYRDKVYDGRTDGVNIELNLQDDNDLSPQRNFLPYHINKCGGAVELELMPFDGYLSAQIGVNSIAITNDGHAIILQQNGSNAIYSGDLAAPTASGSMDWEDIEEANAEIEVEEGGKKRKVIDFRKVIQYSSERELSEEASIARKKKLKTLVKAMQLQRDQIDTYVLGMYRWGSRGGIPGFLCVTRIDKSYNDIRRGIAKSKEVQTNQALDDLTFSLDDAEKEYDVKRIDAYIDKRYKNIPLSLPLYANLLALKDAIANDKNFWKNHGF